jgi:hypothetical protein
MLDYLFHRGIIFKQFLRNLVTKEILAATPDTYHGDGYCTRLLV